MCLWLELLQAFERRRSRLSNSFKLSVLSSHWSGCIAVTSSVVCVVLVYSCLLLVLFHVREIHLFSLPFFLFFLISPSVSRIFLMMHVLRLTSLFWSMYFIIASSNFSCQMSCLASDVFQSFVQRFIECCHDELVLLTKQFCFFLYLNECEYRWRVRRSIIGILPIVGAWRFIICVWICSYGGIFDLR